jgi:lysophospholipase L1-like esterase
MTTRKKIGFALLTMLLAFGLIEGTARIIWWRLASRVMATGERELRNDGLNFMKVPHRLYGYTVKPDFRSPYITINGAGFHQADEIPVGRRDGRLRILCLGESTTFGTGLEANYPSFLRAILDRHASGYSAFEVINAGVPGWTSDQIALRVRNELARYRPDVAVLYVGWNDFQAYSPFEPPPVVPHFDRVYAGRQWKQQATAWSKAVALLSALYHRDGEGGTVAARDAENTPTARYRFLRANLGDIIEALRAGNPRITIFLSTLVGRWPDGTAAEWAKIPPVGWMSVAGVSPQQAPHYVDQLNEQLRAAARGAAVELLDLAAEFDRYDRSQLQFDWAHMHPDGYELMAWTMFSALVEHGIVQSVGADRRFDELTARYLRKTKLPMASISRPEP